jgi:hypothetical protein
MQVSKRFTLAEAERYQMRLCNKYESVKLVRAPMFDGTGQYVWEVSNRVKGGKTK